LKIFFLILLFSLLPLSEILILIYLSELIGRYLVLSIASATGLLGLFISFFKVRSFLAVVKDKIREGYYPGAEFISLAGTFAGSIFLLTPGFITDFLGILLFFTFFQRIAGKIIVKKMESRLKELYEYFKLYEF